MSEQLRVISCRYVDPDCKVIDLVLQDTSSEQPLFDGDPFPYGYIIGSEDTSEVSKYIDQLMKSGQLNPDSYAGPSKESLVGQKVRDKRNRLLSETDRYMTLDYPISEDKRLEMQRYRQSLRDITEQEGFPLHITWPEKPEM